MALIRRLIFLALLIAAVSWPYTGRGQTGAKNGEWRAYSADEASTRYSPLDQITRDNVKNLAGGLDLEVRQLRRRRPRRSTTETTPLMVDGMLYFTAGQRRTVVAANAGTGETLWTWRPDEGARFDEAPRKVHRGVAYWTDGKDERIVVVTPGFQLVALDAKTGQPVPSFGDRRHRRSVQAARQRRAARSDRPDRQQLAAGDLERRDRRRTGADAGRPREHRQRQGRRHGLRRAHRQEAVDVPHDSAQGRARLSRRG